MCTLGAFFLFLALVQMLASAYYQGDSVPSDGSAISAINFWQLFERSYHVLPKR